MALDGLIVAALVEEFNMLLPSNKIEKVYQPEADEIILLIRSQRKNYKLLFSANSNYPRAHFIEAHRDNPTTPPSFCMLLRKHLQGGKITAIEQPHMDRIIKFTIESLDELNVIREKDLVIEMMGKHSNIILVDKKSNTIIDSIKRISFDISRYRQVLPGLQYHMPPSQEKVNPFEINNEKIFQSSLLKNSPSAPIIKSIYSRFLGISPLIAREICHRSEIDENCPLHLLDPSAITKIFTHFHNIMTEIKEKDFSPILYYDHRLLKYMDFSAIPINHLSLYEKIQVNSFSELLETFYQHKDSKERLKQKSQDLRKNIVTKLDRLYNKQKNLLEDLKKAQLSQKYKLYGDLITSNIYQIQKGQEKVELINFFDEDCKPITISLDKRLSPSQNAQKYFKIYNKGKTALLEINHQLEKARSEINYLEQIIYTIEHSTQLSDIEEIRSELEETGFIKIKHKDNKKKTQGKKIGYMKFISSNNLEILVGKNNKQNDEITFKVSSKDDLWFHIKDFPGSHVILKLGAEKADDQSILEAATLAAYYSKAKNTAKVAVDYTVRKNVRKPNGAKPGMVIYDNYSTILVDSYEQNISHIQQIY